MRRDPGKLRIAVSLENALGVEADPEVVRGLHEAAATLRELGHEVEEASPALPGPGSLEIFIDVFGPQVALGIAFGELLAGRPPQDDEIEPLTRAVWERALGSPRPATSPRSRSCRRSRGTRSRSSPTGTC